MDPLTAVIIAAAVTGFTTGTTQVVAERLFDGTYSKLKKLIHNKFGKDSDLADAVDKLEKDPNSKPRQGLVEEEVGKAGAAEDKELLAAAKALKDALESTAEGKDAISKYHISMTNSQAAVIGDNAKIKGGVHFGSSQK